MRAASLALAGILLSASAAFAAEPMAASDIQATFFDGKPFTASTTSGTQFKMIFTADGKMTPQPRNCALVHTEATVVISLMTTLPEGALPSTVSKAMAGLLSPPVLTVA